MPRAIRIAFGRIAQESNALSPLVSTRADFERTHLLSGDKLLEATSARGHEVPGFTKNAELSGFVAACEAHHLEVELVPLQSAWAVPGGPLATADHERFREELRAGLRAAGPLDGVFFSVHGAMNVVGTPEPEVDYFQDIRAVTGESMPLAVTMDLHANLSTKKVSPLNILCAYRTNPHRDHAATGRRAGELLLDYIAGEIQPTAAWRSLPMVVGGGWTLDFLPPTRGLFQRMKWWEKQPGVLRCSIFMSHLWLDQSEIGWATYVLTDGDQRLADKVAEDLAERCWAVRHTLPPEVPGLHSLLPRLRSMRWRRKLGVIAVCDASDVVGAGAPGDSTHLLKLALEEGEGMQWYASVRDPEVVERLRGEAPGAPVELEVGGRLDPDRSPSLPVSGTLMSWEQTDNFGGVATLDLGHVKLVVTEGANLAMKPAFYTCRGLPITDADVCVVKSFFPFRLYFLPYARKCLYIRSQGTTDLDVWRQHKYARPTWPQQDPPGWRAADRARRGVSSG